MSFRSSADVAHHLGLRVISLNTGLSNTHYGAPARRIGRRVGLDRRRRRDSGRRGKHREHRGTSSAPTVSSSAMTRLSTPSCEGLMPASCAAECDRSQRDPVLPRARVEELAIALLESQRLERRAQRVGERSDTRPQWRAGRRARDSRIHRAMLASSACARQMFDVAFSRRMCCSRVLQSHAVRGPALLSTDTPMMRPAPVARTRRASQKTPACGPAVTSGTPSAASCRRDVAPNSPAA